MLNLQGNQLSKWFDIVMSYIVNICCCLERVKSISFLQLTVQSSVFHVLQMCRECFGRETVLRKGMKRVIFHSDIGLNPLLLKL